MTLITGVVEVEELKRQYEADAKAGQPVKLYADDTIRALERIETKWKE